MKRIFYNKIINKLLTSLTLIILLFGYIEPLKVLAADEPKKVITSLNDYVYYLMQDIKKVDSYKNAWNQLGKSKNEEMKTKLMNSFKNINNRYKGMDSNYLFEILSNQMSEYALGDLIKVTYMWPIDDKEGILEIVDPEDSIDLTAAEWMALSKTDERLNDDGWDEITFDNFKGAIERIKESEFGYGDVVTKIENGKIKVYINASGEDTLIEDVTYFFDSRLAMILGDAGDVESDIKESYEKSGVIVKYGEIINKNDEEIGGEDTKTALEKIEEYLILKRGIKEDSVEGIVSEVEILNEKREPTEKNPFDGTDYFNEVDGKREYFNIYYVTVKWNDDELQDEIVEIDLDTGHFNEDIIGKVPYADEQEKIAEELRENKGDLGGWLLEPVFMLVNFVFDSLTSVLGRVMNNNEDGLLYETNKPEPSVDTSTLSDKDVVKVNVADFGVAHIYHTVTYTPEEIFSGKIDLLSIDFISGTKADGTAVTNEGWINIRTVIAQWYKVLRMIAIIGLLSVLIYTGIKIIISANAKDKAKYKEWILNWFIAVAILFTMHYLMAFITSVTGEFSNLLSEANGKVIVEEVDGVEKLEDKTIDTSKLFETNLMGLVRYRIQDNDMGEKIAYEVMYIALFIYTVKFTFVYLKRVLNMAFLTLIAPIVALTYPIDKLNDGNAQGFNMWLKEYIFNALLQPMHLILYYILLGSAIGVAANNPLYGIVVLAFMTQAEDLLKKIFGFSKAGVSMANGMTGAFAAGALAVGVKNIARLGGKVAGGNRPGLEGNNPALDKPKPTEKNREEDEKLFDYPNEQEQNPDEQEKNPPKDDVPETPEEPEKTDEELEQESQRLAKERGILEKFRKDGEKNDWASEKDREEQDKESEKPKYNTSEEERKANKAAFLELEKEQEEKEKALEEARRKKAEKAEAERLRQEEEEKKQQEQKNAEEVTDKVKNIDPVQQLAEEKAKKRQERRQNIANGAKAVGKRLAKPVWEFGKGGKYNGKRLARKIGRAAIGASIGITAAAVQAGISITDGKYSAKEGLLTFAAGYAGGGKVASGIGSIGSTFMEGYTAGNKEAAMKRSKERWGTRDDVIKHNQQKWASSEVRAQMEQRQREHYLPQGINDLSKMDKCFNYVDKIRSEERNKNLTDKQLDTKARVVSDFMDDLDAQGMKSAIRDPDKREKYIETITRGIKDDAERTKTANRYNNLFIEAAKFQDANSNL